MVFPKASRRAQETLNYRVFYERTERPRTSAIEVRRAECLFTLTKSSNHDTAEAIALGRGEGVGTPSRRFLRSCYVEALSEKVGHLQRSNRMVTPRPRP